MLSDITRDMSMSSGWLLLILVVMCAAEATLLLGALAPGEVTVAVAAADLVDSYSLPLVVLAAAAGSMIGQSGGYLLGRLSGNRIRASWVGRRIADRHWRRGEHIVRAARLSTMIAVRFIAVGHTLAPVAAGTLSMPAGRFFRFAAVSSLVWAMVWSAIGVIAGIAGRTANSELLAVILCVAGMVVAGVTLNRRLREIGNPNPRGVSRETVG